VRCGSACATSRQFKRPGRLVLPLASELLGRRRLRERPPGCAASLALQQVADRGHDFGHNAEVAEVVEDDQFRARNEPGGVMGVDDVDNPVASAVQDGDRAPDECDVLAARAGLASWTRQAGGDAECAVD